MRVWLAAVPRHTRQFRRWRHESHPWLSSDRAASLRDVCSLLLKRHEAVHDLLMHHVVATWGAAAAAAAAG